MKYTAQDLKDPVKRKEIEKLINKPVIAGGVKFMLLSIEESEKPNPFYVYCYSWRGNGLPRYGYLNKIEVNEPVAGITNSIIERAAKASNKAQQKILDEHEHKFGKQKFYKDEPEKLPGDPITEEEIEQAKKRIRAGFKALSEKPEEKIEYNPAWCYHCAERGSFCNSPHHASGKTDQPAAEPIGVKYQPIQYDSTAQELLTKHIQFDAHGNSKEKLHVDLLEKIINEAITLERARWEDELYNNIKIEVDATFNYLVEDCELDKKTANRQKSYLMMAIRNVLKRREK